MGRRSSFALTLFFLLTLPARGTEVFERVGYLGASWEGTLLGARQLAIGNADVADPQSAAGWLYNPAALSTGAPMQFAYDRLPDFAESEIENYALAGSWRGIRLGAARSRLEGPRIRFRTAFDPEGLLSTQQSEQTFWVFGAGYELSRFLPAESGLRLALGAALRHVSYVSNIYDADGARSSREELDSDNLDIGASAGLTRGIGRHSLRLLTALSWQSAIHEEFDLAGETLPAPEVVRLGLTAVTRLELFPSLPGRIPGSVEVRLAHAWRERVDSGGADTRQFGAEMLCFDLLALRIGRDERFGDDSLSRGVGLQTPAGLAGPLQVRLHRSWVDDADAVNPSSMKLWGLEVGAGF